MITITRTDTLITRALALVGRTATDGVTMGRLVLVEGESWAVSAQQDGAMVHNHTAHPIAAYANPIAELRTATGPVTVLFESLRPGVTLAKISD